MQLLSMRQQGTDADHSARGPLRRAQTARCRHAQGNGKQSPDVALRRTRQPGHLLV